MKRSEGPTSKQAVIQNSTDKKASKRIDKRLVELCLVRSRAQAQEIIAKGLVSVEGCTVTKSGAPVENELPASSIHIAEDSLLKYVSRGGVKLEGALSHLKLSVHKKTVFDIGMSTGGFADCLLQSGAAKVIGIDVGHGQLSNQLNDDPRVVSHEGFHFNQLRSEMTSECSLCVGDLSFVSLTKLFPVLQATLPMSCEILFLVKPQFELSAKDLNKNGVVKSESSYSQVKENVINSAQSCGFDVKAYFESSIVGGEGNREFFIYAEKNL